MEVTVNWERGQCEYLRGEGTKGQRVASVLVHRIVNVVFPYS